MSRRNKGAANMDRLKPFSVGLAAAITLMSFNILCAATVGLWPDATITIFNAFAHGLDFTAVKSAEPFGFGRFVLGLISVGVIGLLVGSVFAWSYNSAQQTLKMELAGALAIRLLSCVAWRPGPPPMVFARSGRASRCFDGSPLLAHS